MNNRMIVYQGNVDVLNQEEHNLNKQFVKNRDRKLGLETITVDQE